MRLGIDFWSLRSQGWNIFEFLDYADRLGLDVMHTGVRTTTWEVFESFDEDYLKRVRERAEELDIDIEVGGCALCPTSTAFAGQGTCLSPIGSSVEENTAIAIEDFRQLVRIAHAVGSPSIRCYLGHGGDRRGELPLEAHIESMLAVIDGVRDIAVELGVKLGIENHSDFEARELKAFIEEAGPEVAGVCLDTGNPPYMGESPFVTLEHLAPYVVSSHVRDTAIWQHPRGAAAQWVVMGEGTVGIEEWARLFQEKCPDVPFNLEVITGTPPRVVNYLEPEFWEAYPDRPASEFAEFLTLVREGHPFMGSMLVSPREGDVPEEYGPAMVAQERFDLERSLRYCKEVLGLGEK